MREENEIEKNEKKKQWKTHTKIWIERRRERVMNEIGKQNRERWEKKHENF